MTDITDPRVLILNCLYPLYLSGDKGIKDRTSKILNEMVEDNDPLSLFQTVSFLYEQDCLLSKNVHLPFIVYDTSICINIKRHLKLLEHKLTTYNEGEFAFYSRSMYQMIERMMQSIRWNRARLVTYKRRGHHVPSRRKVPKKVTPTWSMQA